MSTNAQYSNPEIEGSPGTPEEAPEEISFLRSLELGRVLLGVGVFFTLLAAIPTAIIFLYMTFVSITGTEPSGGFAWENVDSLLLRVGDLVGAAFLIGVLITVLTILPRTRPLGMALIPFALAPFRLLGKATLWLMGWVMDQISGFHRGDDEEGSSKPTAEPDKGSSSTALQPRQ